MQNTTNLIPLGINSRKVPSPKSQAPPSDTKQTHSNPINKQFVRWSLNKKKKNHTQMFSLWAINRVKNITNSSWRRMRARTTAQHGLAVYTHDGRGCTRARIDTPPWSTDSEQIQVGNLTDLILIESHGDTLQVMPLFVIQLDDCC